MQYTFKNINAWGDPVVDDYLGVSMQMWLEWALLCAGAIQTCQIGSPGYDGIDLTSMSLETGPNYLSGLTYRAPRSQWVWEQSVPGQTTIVPSIYVDNILITSGYTINYPMGQINFQNQLPKNSLVNAAYTYRYVQVRRADEPWFRKLLQDTFSVQPAPTPASIPPQSLVQLPCYVVEVIPVSMTGNPYELGNTSRFHKQNIAVHCLAETPWERKSLSGILQEQYDIQIPGVNLSTISMPLAFDGQIINPVNYPNLQAANQWRPIRLRSITSTEVSNMGPTLYWSTTMIETETIIA